MADKDKILVRVLFVCILVHFAASRFPALVRQFYRLVGQFSFWPMDKIEIHSYVRF